MRLQWVTLFWGAIASSIPLTSSHEIRLAYLPSIEPDHSIDSYLSIKWSIQNDTLYANNNRVFPPSTSMQLQVPHIQGTQNTHSDFDDHDLDLSYSLEVSPLSRDDFASPNRILQVKMELLDLQGRPVTPNSVELDLVAHSDGSQHIAQIRLQPGRILHDDSPHSRPWQMKFWKTQMGTLSKPENEEQTPHPIPGENLAPAEAPESHVGYLSSPYWSPTYMDHQGSKHRGHAFLRMVRPVILPALFGAIAGLAACLVGFVAGHVFLSLATRMGLRKQHQQRLSLNMEDDVEKSPLLVPETHATSDLDE
ncbi:hypothetical protein N7495_009183 [Penicillium taxi]|uniref:uncharacterized protein n=1 Tax=Penicillium taxi TaxID=168475 RepID=UPI002544E893|nr:uncharacterized protein N7495_009183 [Penicillium taxi]KAJ5884673.1 hypothetical protein N7495_009183 [Penicillium taxi]